MKSKTIISLALSALLLYVAPAFGATPFDLVPLPVRVTPHPGNFQITAATQIICSDTPDCLAMAAYLNDYAGAWLGAELPVEKASPRFVGVLQKDYIALSIDTLLRGDDGIRLTVPSEGYYLRTTPGSVQVVGVDRAGLFNGIQTLLQLMPEAIYSQEPSPDPLMVSCAEIVDWPAFSYRGQHLDVARTFIPFEQVKQFIDRLSHHKINRLHWHLVDDEGWRIDIKAYPELARKGGFRGPKLPVKPIYGSFHEDYGGYYTQEQIREIVAFAAERNIVIIPEIDLPGHSRAVARIHPEILCAGPHDTNDTAGYDRRNVWCATKESNYVMLEKILTEVCDLFPSEYIHIGGDEVLKSQWLACPTCKLKAVKGSIAPIQDYFVDRLSKFLISKGRKPAVWDESAESGKLNKKALVWGWQHVKSCLDVTAAGYKTVIVPGSYFYFDMKQSPWEPGLTWAGLLDTHRVYSFDFKRLGFSDAQMKNVAGLQGAFFAELLLSNGLDYLDYQTYPRICAISEVCWTQASLRDDDDFHKRLYGKHQRRLDAMGIGYRLPIPDATYDNKGKITARMHYGDNEIRYTDDGTEPLLTSMTYQSPFEARDVDRYLFRSVNGERMSAVMPALIRHSGSVAANATAQMNIPLPDEGEGSALWYVRVRAFEPGIVTSTLQVTAADTSYYIVRNGQTVNDLHQMRLYVTPKVRGGNMILNFKNPTGLTAKVEVIFERSPYIEPAVTITSTMPQDTRFPFKNLTDYNFTTYGRTARTCRRGDSLTFTFAKPVDGQSIEVRTGLSYLPRYQMDGYLETSTDGRTFTRAATLHNGCATIHPEESLKAIRLVSTIDGNGEANVAFQDLKIVPRTR